MDQLNNLYQVSVYLLPWATFMIGFMGSLHCLSMCGGLVVSCAPKRKNNVAYQFGRLFSYSILAFFAGYIGYFFSFSKTNAIVTVIPALFIGALLIYIGTKGLFKSRIHKVSQNRASSFFQRIWAKIIPKPGEGVSYKTSFAVGAFSILLPCGLLYGVVLILATFESPWLALICIWSFWFGTLPLMAGAPDVIKKILLPLQKRLPVFSSVFLILIGLGTVVYRIYLVFQQTPHH